MKNKLLVLLSLTMIVFSTSAFAKKVEKMPVERDGLYYEHLSPNLANGNYETYHTNGRLKQRKTYKTGKQNGPFEWYYDNGQLQAKATYKNDKEDGLYEFYFDNGQLEIKSIWKDGKLDGLSESYKSDGTLIEKCFYVNGKQYECE